MWLLHPTVHCDIWLSTLCLRHSSGLCRDVSCFSRVNSLAGGYQLITSTNYSLPLVNWANDTGMQCFEIYWYSMPCKQKILSTLAIEIERKHLLQGGMWLSLNLCIFFLLLCLKIRPSLLSLFMFYEKAHQGLLGNKTLFSFQEILNPGLL